MEVVTACVVWQLLRAVKHIRDDRRDLDELPMPPARPAFASEIYSCVTKGAYARAKGEDNPGPNAYFDAAGYELVDAGELDRLLGRLRYTTAEIESSRSSILAYSTFFRRVSPEKSEHAVAGSVVLPSMLDEEGNPVQRPDFIVAVRGTVKDNPIDLWDDLNIAFDNLAIDRKILFLVDVIHRIYRMQLGDVAVVGHSLGAYIALLVSRQVVLLNLNLNLNPTPKPLSTYAFNPPNLTIDVLLKKAVTSVANGAGDLLHRVDYFDLGAKKAVRAVADSTMRSVSQYVRNLFEDPAREEVTEAAALVRSGWCPRICVNDKDVITNEFCKYYGYGRGKLFSTAAPILDKFGMRTKSYHLVPLGRLIVNRRGKGLIEAHKLGQWCDSSGHEIVEFAPALEG